MLGFGFDAGDHTHTQAAAARGEETREVDLQIQQMEVLTS
jgi:hypothetical protein